MVTSPSNARLRIAAASVAIVVLYGAQVWAAKASGSDPHAVHALVMIVTGLLQSAALLQLYRDAGRSSARSIVLAVVPAAIALLVLSALAPNTDDDAAAYVAYAKLPAFAQAYAPSPVAISSPGFERVASTWPQLPPLVYGPLWLAVDRALVGWAPSFAAALGILRAVNVVLLGALVLGLRRAGCNAATLAVTALNPMLWFYFVVQAHNDLGPLVLVVAGTAIARTRPLLGALVAGAAALIKIVFVAIAILAYAGRRAWPQTLAYAAASLAVTAVVSWVFGGAAYLHAMTEVGHMQIATRADLPHLFAASLHAVLAAIAAAAIVAAVARNAFVAPAAYSFSAISTIVYPWYLGWCIPYAVRIPTFTGVFFVSLPAIAHLIDPHFSLSPARSFALLVPYYAVVIVLVARSIVNARRTPLNAPE
jgi:hypothetical protein